MGLEPLGKSPYRVGETGFFKALPDLLFINAFHLLGDVLRYRRFQQGKLLKDRGKQLVVCPPVELTDVYAVEAHRPLGGIEKAAQELDQRGLACAVQAHQRYFFAPVEGETEIVNGVLRRAGIAVGDMLQL